MTTLGRSFRFTRIALTALVVVFVPLEVLAQTRTINLNTGYDQWLASPALISIGQKDNEWRVTVDPTLGNAAPPERPADVVTNSPGWFDPLAAFPSSGFPYLNSQWISVKSNRRPANPAGTPYQYAYYFTLPPGFSSPQLNMNLNADDRITAVTLNACPLPTGTGGAFNGIAPLTISSSQASCFQPGPHVNVITVTVEDTSGVITGLIAAGTVTYEDCSRQPVCQIPGLQSITFWESTFASPTPFTFPACGPALTNRLNDPLNSTNRDFEGVIGAEFYDVFISDWDGSVNPNGAFVTIEAVWDVGAPSGGGLNIARVDLNGQYANSVASFVAIGNNAIPLDVGKAVDGNLSTDTTMGSTIGQTQRLRVTVGFPCCTPPPSGMVAWWPLNEQVGAPIVKDIVGGHDGTPSPGGLIGNLSPLLGPTPASLWPPAGGGEVGDALYFWHQFDNRYVQVPGAPFQFGTTDFSIDAWVFITQYNGTQVQPIVEKMQCSGTTPVRGYRFLMESGVLKFDVFGTLGNASTDVGIANQLSQNVWHHVAVTYRRPPQSANEFIGLYIDGVQGPFNNLQNRGDLSNTSDLIIGGSILGPAINYLDVGIDELEIFSRALSQAEIQSILAAGTAGKCKPQCVSPPSRMVSWWPADGNANDIADGNDGMLKGNAAYAPGMVGPAFSFAAQGDYVEVSNAANLNFGPAGPGGDLSIDAWIKTTSTASVLPIVDKRDLPGGASGPQSTGYFLFLSNGKLAFQLGDGTFFNFISSGPDLRDGLFHHVAVTVDRSSTTGLHLYEKGLAVLPSFDPTNRPGSLTNNRSLFIGQHSGDPTNSFPGLIDEVEIFNRALSQPEIQSIFAAGTAGKCKRTCAVPPSGMVAWWPLEETSGPTVADIAGNLPNHNGTSMPGPINAGGPTSLPAEVNNGLLFCGSPTPTYVTVADKPDLNFGTASNFSIDTWIKTSTLSGFQMIVAKLNWPNPTAGYRFYVDNTNSLKFDIGPGAAFTSTVVLTPGTWYHAAVTVNRTQPFVTFYINGLPNIVPGTSTNNFNASSLFLNLLIGGTHETQLQPLLGCRYMLDAVEIFSRALLATEIQSIYRAGAAGKCKCAIVSNEKISCDPNAADSYTYTFTVTNFSNSTASALPFSPPVGVTITPGSIGGLSLAPGGSTMATVTISGAGAGATVCFSVGLGGPGVGICGTEHCIRLPQCPRFIEFH